MSQADFNATKAMARSFATRDEGPDVVCDPNAPPHYDPDTHTVSVPGFVVTDMPKDLRTMYRAYFDHEMAESDITSYPEILLRRYGGSRHVPENLRKCVGSINDGLRVDAWQGQRFPGAAINIERAVEADLDDLRDVYAEHPEAVHPDRVGVAFVATVARYIADGVITVDQAMAEFSRFGDLFDKVEEELRWVQDNVDHDDPASEKLEQEVITTGERIYYTLRGVEPPPPDASQQECQDAADEARKSPKERQQDQGQGEPQKGMQGGGQGSSSGQGKPDGQPQAGGGSAGESPSNEEPSDSEGTSDGDGESDEDSDASQSEASGDGDTESQDSDDESSDKSEGSDESGETSSSESFSEQDGDEGDTEPAEPQMGTDGGTIGGDESMDWDVEDRLADQIQEKTEQEHQGGSTFVRHYDPHDHVTEDKAFNPLEQEEEDQRHDRAETLKKDYRRYGGTLATRIRQALFTPGPVKVDRQKRGNLDQRRVEKLATGERNAFKKTMPRDRQDVAVSLAVDESGSMGGEKRNRASDLALTWAEACDRLEAPLEVMGWTTGRFRILKRFDDRISDDEVWYNLAGISASGGTPMSDAIEVAAERLAQRPEDQKILFCLTDGLTSATDPLRHALEMCRQHGITVIFIGAGVDNPAEAESGYSGWQDIQQDDLFAGWVTVMDPQDLALTASKKLVKVIRQGRRG